MVIEVNPLDIKSVEAAIKKVNDYQDSLIEKCHTLLDRLVEEVGLPAVKVHVNAADGDSDKGYTTLKEWDISDPNVEGLQLTIAGRQMVFIEFGAGVYYNGKNNLGKSPHDRGVELGFTIGSWKAGPRYGRKYSQGQFDEWDSPIGPSKGTQSTAPVYNAAQAMKLEIARIATEVFGKDGG